jgi:hypothetical protein
MKQLEDHKMMNPQFLYILFIGLAIRVQPKGVNNAGIKLTTKLG